jgi:hypothetical protein
MVLVVCQMAIMSQHWEHELMEKVFCIFNPTRFQIVDVEYDTRQMMEIMLEQLKIDHPHEDLIVIEVA